MLLKEHKGVKSRGSTVESKQRVRTRDRKRGEAGTENGSRERIGGEKFEERYRNPPEKNNPRKQSGRSIQERAGEGQAETGDLVKGRKL